MRLAAVFALLCCCACAKGAGPKSFGRSGTLAAFDLDSDPAQAGAFWELPYPSDLRLTAEGRPQLASFPNPRGLPLLETFRQLAMERRGFPALPVAYFRFSAPLDKGAQGVLLDLAAQAVLPSVSELLQPDDYVPQNLLAVAPRQGFVLRPGRQYAVVVLRQARDAQGALLGVPPALDQLLQGVAPEAALGVAARDLYAPLPAALRKAGIDPADVAAATVFTTGDVVAETAAMSAALQARYAVSVASLTLDPAYNPLACVLHGGVTYPQFQKGAPPFNTDGLFVPGPDGLPQKQRDEVAPVTLVIPRTLMPAAGYPLALYFHGSGGASHDVIDNGPTLVLNGPMQQGTGPGYILAMHGIASAGSALPVNPERLPGAAETAYLNFQNLPAMRDTFRQGIVEQRLFLDALLKLQLPPALLSGCTGAALPPGQAAFHFDAASVVAQGQSMGGMYTNLISAVEPRIRAAVPTGAGGFWTYFILVTHLHDALPQLVSLLLYAGQPIRFMHPALSLIETAWEPADPFVSMPRLGLRPLPGHPVRPVYEPVGKDDRYFPTPLYDAVALAYGHEEAGSVQWSSMQDALKLARLDGLLQYPVAQNRTSENGAPYTGVVVQYLGDGIEDPHAIYRQLDAVKYQYGCFLETFLATGKAVVPAPAPLGTPCPR